MKKKLMSLMLALVMCLSLSAPAFAADQSANQQTALEAAIQAEIQREEDRIFTSVYAQLEAQDALGLMDIYKELLTPQIEADVREQYGQPDTRAITTKYTFNNGGTLGYTSTLGATVLNTYLTSDQYAQYVANQRGSAVEFTLRSILTAIGESKGVQLAKLISGWGFAYDFLMVYVTINDDLARKSIAEAKFYTQIMNVSAGAEQGSVLIGWKNHPVAIIPDDSKDVHVYWF